MSTDAATPLLEGPAAAQAHQQSFLQRQASNVLAEHAVAGLASTDTFVKGVAEAKVRIAGGRFKVEMVLLLLFLCIGGILSWDLHVLNTTDKDCECNVNVRFWVKLHIGMQLILLFDIVATYMLLEHIAKSMVNTVDAVTEEDWSKLSEQVAGKTEIGKTNLKFCGNKVVAKDEFEQLMINQTAFGPGSTAIKCMLASMCNIIIIVLLGSVIFVYGLYCMISGYGKCCDILYWTCFAFNTLTLVQYLPSMCVPKKGSA